MRRNIDPSVKEAYMEWLKTPPGLRDPKTKRLMAEELGVSERTLINWESTEEFKVELLKFKKGLASRMYADLIGAAYEIAMSGPMPQRMPAIKMLLDHIDFTEEEDAESTALSAEVAEAIKEVLKKDGIQVIGE